jgi:hypothetical protein
MQFVLVNGRSPRPESSCALCCETIGESYLRELTTHLPTAITSATSVIASSPSQDARNMRGHHDNPRMGTIRSRPVMRSRQVSLSKKRAVRNPNRAAWLWTIGNTLKAEYGAVATPLPSSLAALVEQLEMQKEER